jgi:hypothetical protein
VAIHMRACSAASGRPSGTSRSRRSARPPPAARALPRGLLRPAAAVPWPPASDRDAVASRRARRVVGFRARGAGRPLGRCARGEPPPTAATRWGQKEPGRLSLSSSASHATTWPWSATAASHWVSRDVLPNPADAATRTSLDPAPRSSRSINLGRRIRPDRGAGTRSLVATIRLSTWQLAGARGSSQGPAATARPFHRRLSAGFCFRFPRWLVRSTQSERPGRRG